jgi:hypothetical protein
VGVLRARRAAGLIDLTPDHVHGKELAAIARRRERRDSGQP